jgi:hypothetical protein
MTRPCGSYGDVALALRIAALEGPGTVRTLAQRAQVGYSVARYTASRLCSRGDLVVLDGAARPAVLVAPELLQSAPAVQAPAFTEEDAPGVHDALAMLSHNFWATAPAATAQGVEDG